MAFLLARYTCAEFAPNPDSCTESQAQKKRPRRDGIGSVVSQLDWDITVARAAFRAPISQVFAAQLPTDLLHQQRLTSNPFAEFDDDPIAGFIWAKGDQASSNQRRRKGNACVSAGGLG